MAELIYRKRRFCREWLINGNNATKAAISVGYSAHTADVQGSRLLTEPAVIEYVLQLQRETDKRLDITRDDIIGEMARIGMVDTRRLFNENGSLKPIHMLDDDTAAAVKSVKVVSRTLGHGEEVEIEHTHEIQLHAKQPALSDLGKHFNIFEDHQKSGKGEMTVIIEGKDERA